MNLIRKFNGAWGMAVSSGEKDRTLMQFIDNRTGRRRNYWPDGSPSQYKNHCKIICIFRVHYKYRPPFLERFFHWWKASSI